MFEVVHMEDYMGYWVSFNGGLSKVYDTDLCLISQKIISNSSTLVILLFIL